MKIIASISLTRSSITNQYITSEPINYDMYLLSMLIQEHDSAKLIHFSATSSIKSCATSQLFLYKNKSTILIFSIYDLVDADDLCLPKSPKLVLSIKNFMQFLRQKQLIIDQQKTLHCFIAQSDTGNVYLTTNITSLTQQSAWSNLIKKITCLFTRQVR